MARRIVFLRGINLASRNRVAMPRLREVLTEAGFAHVRTLVQSGNIVLDGTGDVDAAVAKVVEAEFGVECAIVSRTRAQLEKVVAGNPLLEEAESDPKRFHVYFLSAAPARSVVNGLTGDVEAPEALAFKGSHAYAWFADGMQGSKLARRLTDERLGVTATARNWRTVVNVLELARED